MRRLRIPVLAAGLCFVFGFMYVYGFYKSLRGNFFDALTRGTISEVEESTGRTVDLHTTTEHGSCELHIEFCVPQRSNSGVSKATRAFSTGSEGQPRNDW